MTPAARSGPRRDDDVPSHPRAVYRIRARLWLYPGKGGWHFIHLPARESRAVRMLFGHGAKGFGGVPVHVTIGTTGFSTSLFPDRKSNSYLLAIKASVREAEGIAAGDTVRAVVRVR